MGAPAERDRKRDASLRLAGYRVLRITHRRLEAEPAEVMGAVCQFLDRV
jgi:very-short-patch-repair endonuclease